MANAVAIVTPVLASGDGLVKVEEMTKKPKLETLALHEELIAARLAQARALLNDVRLQRDMEDVVQKKEKTARLLTVGQPKQEKSTVVEQRKKDVLTVIMKAREQIGTLTASLEQAQKTVDALKKEVFTASQRSAEWREDKERSEYERNGMEAGRCVPSASVISA